MGINKFTESELRAVVKKILENYLSDDSVNLAFKSPSSNLQDLGLDSILAFHLINDLAAFHINITYADFKKSPTLEYLLKLRNDG